MKIERTQGDSWSYIRSHFKLRLICMSKTKANNYRCDFISFHPRAKRLPNYRYHYHYLSDEEAKRFEANNYSGKVYMVSDILKNDMRLLKDLINEFWVRYKSERVIDSQRQSFVGVE